MEATNLHITEYRGNQDIDYYGVTSFKVQNHGEAVVEINTIPIYPGQTEKIIEEDGTQCDFKMTAKFTEEGKIQKFRAIYKQFGFVNSSDNLHPELPYMATLYSYEQGDIVNFSHNIGGHTILTRSFDGGLTFLPENDIDLGFIPANIVTKYDLGGYLHTNAIQFRNDDLEENSEIFIVGEVIEEPWVLDVKYRFQYSVYGNNLDVFVNSNKTSLCLFEYFELPSGLQSWNQSPVTVGITQQNFYGDVQGFSLPFKGLYYSVTRLETGEVKYYLLDQLGFDELLQVSEIDNPRIP